MALYYPPTETLPIFDSSVFITNDTILTQEEADLRYLRFPYAQGEGTLQNTNVVGALDVTGDINANNNINVNQTITADIFSLPNSSSKFQVDDDMYLGKSTVDSTPYLLANGSTIINGTLNIQDPFNNIYILDDTNFTYNANRNINSKHTFNVQGALITTINKNGLTIPTGKYMKSPEIILGTNDLQGLLDLKAPKSNPTFTGTVTVNSGNIQFSNDGYGIRWGADASKIYDNGDLHINTDDTMYISAPSSLNISTTMVYTDGLVKADNYVISPTFRFLNDLSFNTYISWSNTGKYMDFTSYKGNFAWYYNFQNGAGNYAMTLNTAGVLDVPNTIQSTNCLTNYIQFKNETSGTTSIGVDTINKYMTFLSYSGGYKWYYNYGIVGGGEMDLERTGVLSGLKGLQVSGTVKSQGYACNAGTTGTPTANMFNFLWATDDNGDLKVKSYIDTTKIGSLVVSDEDGIVTGLKGITSTGAVDFTGANVTAQTEADGANNVAVATTAFVKNNRQSWGQAYNGTNTINIPALCSSIDVILFGSGGKAGTNFFSITSTQYNGYSGGGGAGGNIMRLNGINLPGGQITVTTTPGVVGGITTLTDTKSGSLIASVGNGGVGGNAISGAVGTAGAVNVSTGTVNFDYIDSYNHKFGMKGTAGIFVTPPGISNSNYGNSQGNSIKGGGAGAGGTNSNTTYSSVTNVTLFTAAGTLGVGQAYGALASPGNQPEQSYVGGGCIVYFNKRYTAV